MLRIEACQCVILFFLEKPINMLHYVDQRCVHLVKNAEVFEIALQKQFNCINNYVG